MVLDGKLWLSMFWDKRQIFGGWGWAAEGQEGGDQKQGVFPGSLRLTAPRSTLPCDRRSLLSLGPSSRSWLGRLSECCRQGSSRLSVFSLVRNEVPGASGRVMGWGLVAGQGLQTGKWCWQECHQGRGQAAPTPARVSSVHSEVPHPGLRHSWMSDTQAFTCRTSAVSRIYSEEPSTYGTRGGPSALPVPKALRHPY